MDTYLDKTILRYGCHGFLIDEAQSGESVRMCSALMHLQLQYNSEI